MKRTKDQRDLEKVLERATLVRDDAYSLFSRRLDTQRNVDAFIKLLGAFNCMKDACELLEAAVREAVEVRSSDQNSVCNEILVRSGKATIQHEPLSNASLGNEPLPGAWPNGHQAKVLPFTTETRKRGNL